MQLYENSNPRDRAFPEPAQNASTTTKAKVRMNPGLRSLVIAGVLTLGICGLALALATEKAGSMNAGLALLKGDRIYAGPSGLQVMGDGLSASEITLTNLWDRPVEIVGYSAVCACVNVSGLPIILKPHEVRKVSTTAFSRQAKDVPLVFFTNCDDQPNVVMGLKVLASE